MRGMVGGKWGEDGIAVGGFWGGGVAVREWQGVVVGEEEGTGMGMGMGLKG